MSGRMVSVRRVVPGFWQAFCWSCRAQGSGLVAVALTRSRAKMRAYRHATETHRG